MSYLSIVLGNSKSPRLSQNSKKVHEEFSVKSDGQLYMFKRQRVYECDNSTSVFILHWNIRFTDTTITQGH